MIPADEDEPVSKKKSAIPRFGAGVGATVAAIVMVVLVAAGTLLVGIGFVLRVSATSSPTSVSETQSLIADGPDVNYGPGQSGNVDGILGGWTTGQTAGPSGSAGSVATLAGKPAVTGNAAE